MTRAAGEFRINKIDIADMLRASSVVCTILLVFVFFTGCQTTKKEQADSNSVMREGPSDHEIHGEVGVMYGQGISRR